MKWVKQKTLSVLQRVGIKWVDTTEERNNLLTRAWNECPIKDEKHLVEWLRGNVTPTECHLYFNNMLHEYVQRLLRKYRIPA